MTDTDARATVRQRLTERLDETALSDSGLALDHDEATVAARRSGAALDERGEFLLPADEPRRNERASEHRD
jgi:hypothetical protein